MICSSHTQGLIVRHVYIDEAGIGNPAIEPYTVVVGVMLHVDQQYAAIQKYLLDMADDLVAPDKERPLDFVFHAKELWHGNGFFPRDKWSRERRLEILGHIADIPREFQLPIIYSCVERSQFPAKLPPDDSPKRLFRDARAKATMKCHTMCFLSCLEQVDRYVVQIYEGEKVFAVVELHEDHKIQLLSGAQLLSNPRLRRTIENDPDINWPPISHIVEEPLFVRKSGSSPVQVDDACAFILSRALAEAEKSGPLLEKIQPNLVAGFIRGFLEPKARG